MAAGSLVAVHSNAELDANPALMGVQPPPAPPPEENQETELDGLSVFMDGKWEIAKRAKIGPERQILKNLRACDNQYEPEMLAAIQKVMGVEKPGYMPITSTKARAAKSYIRDYLFNPQPGQEPWDIEPTPIPELPGSVQQALFEKAKAWVEQQAMMYFQVTGQLPAPETMMYVMDLVAPEAEKQIETMIKEAADTAARKMRKKIRDQFAEGGWEEALRDSVDDLVEAGTMIVKGPVFMRSPVAIRELSQETGRYETRIEDRIIPGWKRVDPLMFYPSPDASKKTLPWSFEKMRLTRRDLSELKGMPGYKDEYIDKILELYDKHGLVEWTNADQPKHELAGKGSVGIDETELIDALEFQGTAPGRELIAWGMGPDIVSDPNKEYEIQAWKIGRWVIKAMLNPDPLGKKNVFYCGFYERNNSFWHRGVPEMIETTQNIGNQAVRALRMNVGIGSGPQIEVDKTRLAPGQKAEIRPYMIWLTTSAGMMESPAVKFNQPALVTRQLMEVYRFCLDAADDDTGIPRYFYSGEAKGGKAGDTMGGLQMLMTNATKGLKSVIQSIDTGVIEPSVRTQYHYNLMFEEDVSTIGDLRIMAKGSKILQSREQSATRKMEMLDRTNNPLDNQVMGASGRAILLKQAFDSVGLDGQKILDDEEKIRKIADGIRSMYSEGIIPGMPPGAQAGQSAPPPGMSTLDAAGSPAGGEQRTRVGAAA